MPAPVPLPVGWHIQYVAICPNCGTWMHVVRREESRDTFEREMYCANEECVQHGNSYETDLTPRDGLVVTRING